MRRYLSVVLHALSKFTISSSTRRSDWRSSSANSRSSRSSALKSLCLAGALADRLVIRNRSLFIQANISLLGCHPGKSAGQEHSWRGRNRLSIYLRQALREWIGRSRHLAPVSTVERNAEADPPYRKCRPPIETDRFPSPEPSLRSSARCAALYMRASYASADCFACPAHAATRNFSESLERSNGPIAKIAVSDFQSPYVKPPASVEGPVSRPRSGAPTSRRREGSRR